VPGEETPATYVVDACSFTELRRTYPRPHFDAVWKLVEKLAAEGRLHSVDEVLRELSIQDDEVAEWASKHSAIFLPLDEPIQLKAREILKSHPTLIDLKKKKSGADPFLIGAAIVSGATVVTQEQKSGGPHAVKIPDVCQAYKVRCIPLLELLKAEGLST
jgi:hypothetical protein